MALPPVEAGAVHVPTTWPLAAPLGRPVTTVAVTPVGGPGGVDGMAVLLGTEAGPVPAALVAVTVKV
jgi:hypothetical protein